MVISDFFTKSSIHGCPYVKGQLVSNTAAHFLLLSVIYRSCGERICMDYPSTPHDICVCGNRSESKDE